MTRLDAYWLGWLTAGLFAPTWEQRAAFLATAFLGWFSLSVIDLVRLDRQAASEIRAMLREGSRR